jgi:site-specific DNA recombinase
VRRPYPTDRPYALRSLLICGLCNRRMQGSWNNDQAYYRCRLPSRERRPDHPRGVYLREVYLREAIIVGAFPLLWTPN